MNITARPGPINGMFILESDVSADSRGAFTRLFCKETFAKLGLPTYYPQHNLSTNPYKGTLRGLHYQLPAPEEQAASSGEYKLVRCISGRIWDVVADVRAGSATFGKWWGGELGGEGNKAVFIPVGCAHGCMTLTEQASIYYLMGAMYRAENQRGIRFDDPTLGIAWPLPTHIISERDRNLPYVKDVFL